MQIKSNQAKGVDSARRVLQILLNFTDSAPELTVEEISHKFGISIPSTYRYIALLRELYFLEERRRGVYSLTSQMFRLAQIAENTLDIGNVAQPLLEELVRRTGATALIFKKVRETALCVSSAVPKSPAHISLSPGDVLPLDKGAGSKVILASLPIDKQKKYLAQLRPKASEQELQVFLDGLETIFEVGHATSDSEVDAGIFATAAPVVIQDRTVASLVLADFSFKLTEQKKQKLITVVQESALDLQKDLVLIS